MKKRAGIEKQNQERPIAMTIAMQQSMLPLLVAMDATKKGLLAFVQQMGMVALSELLAFEAAQIAGPKGKHNDGRTHHHWGAAATPMCFGGRNVSIAHPRVRARGGMHRAKHEHHLGHKAGRSVAAVNQLIARWSQEGRPTIEDARALASVAAKTELSKFEPCLSDKLLAELQIARLFDLDGARKSTPARVAD